MDFSSFSSLRTEEAGSRRAMRKLIIIVSSHKSSRRIVLMMNNKTTNPVTIQSGIFFFAFVLSLSLLLLPSSVIAFAVSTNTMGSDTAATCVQAKVQYLHPESEEAQYNASQAGEAQEATHGGDYVTKVVNIEDGRSKKDWSLDKNGFRLVAHTPTSPPIQDYHDDAELESKYNPQIEEFLLKEIPGAKQVHVFDHTRRSSTSSTRTSKVMREPSAVIHNDYTAWSAEKRLREIMGDDVQYSRFAVVNVWRPLCPVVETWPMTLCDASTVQVEQDLISVPRVSKDGRKGEIQMAKHNPQHQWYYFPKMTPDEVLLLKTFDSCQDVNQYTPHTAFDLASAIGNDNAPSRESLETRTFVLF